MATRRRVAMQHEDWLNLTSPEPPWFAVPAVKRAFPNGLDRVAPEVRAEHKLRWNGDERNPGARSAPDRGEYVEWLLRDVLGWGDGYLTADRFPADLAPGVTRHEVTVVPTGAYRPASVAPVGLFDNDVWSEPVDAARTRVLVFVLPAGTDPGARPLGKVEVVAKGHVEVCGRQGAEWILPLCEIDYVIRAGGREH